MIRIVIISVISLSFLAGMMMLQMSDSYDRSDRTFAVTIIQQFAAISGTVPMMMMSPYFDRLLEEAYVHLLSAITYTPLQQQSFLFL
jgi:hypothetical protein